MIDPEFLCFLQNSNHPGILKDGIWMHDACEKIYYPEHGHEHLQKFEDKSFWFEHRNNLIGKIVYKYTLLKPLFDIGGGGGIVSKYLQDIGINTILLEPLLSGATIAKKRGVKNVLCCTLDFIKRKKSIPNAGCFDVIEHIEDDVVFLSELADKMEDNGMLFITVPAYQFLWTSADERAGHFRRYTRNMLKKTVVKSGFDVQYCAYFFSYLLPLIYFLGRKDCKESGTEHMVTGWKKTMIRVLNKVDFILMKLFRGCFPGASLILVATKNTVLKTKLENH